MYRLLLSLCAAFAFAFSASMANADSSVLPMMGSNLIEGYKGSVDAGAKGRYKVDTAKGIIKGGYKGLKTRETHRAIVAWLHKTATQK